MILSEKIAHFNQLGTLLKALSTSDDWPGFESGINQEEWEDLKASMAFAKIKNGWFEMQFVQRAFKEWGELLQKEQLKSWMDKYSEVQSPKNVAIIAAGNIPMVGFHDLLSVVLSGNKAHFKLSSDDSVLIPALLKVLFSWDPRFKEVIHLYENSEQLKNFDAVIATGNNNSARYFEYYFDSYPHIIRKNRTSLALLDGDESDEELKALGDDIFAYFGLGCRNVSHILLPEDFDLNRIFGNIVDFNEIIYNKKYGNNYDYHKAIFLMNSDDLLENGFVMFRESKELFAPLSVIHYHRYANKVEAENYINNHKDHIQALVGKGHVPFGKAQKPALDNYADGIDTMNFLLQLNAQAE